MVDQNAFIRKGSFFFFYTNSIFIFRGIHQIIPKKKIHFQGKLLLTSLFFTKIYWNHPLIYILIFRYFLT